MATRSKAFPLRFKNARLRERLEEQAATEHRSMNDVLNEAIEAWLDGRVRPVETVDKATLEQMMRDIAAEDNGIFEALKHA